ncbi:hypothetical protein SDC9_125433 [bioreactor metagenome]|uniref:Uncharacterized protein n=1 Tax=bioreactor metagenome TaxID=1076179 RepID=A0A645CNS4_9ZZZZ
MRERSLRSTAPNLAKSTFGHGSRSRPTPEPEPPFGATADCALVCTAPVITCLVKACTSSAVIRPLLPVPFTSSSGTPSSRANLRTEGDAYGKLPDGGTVGLCAGTAVAAATGAAAGADTGAAGAAAATAGAGADAADAGAAAAPCALIWPTTSPTLTLSPTFSVSAVMVPAAGDGISIDALSDSTVNSDCSAVTVSPTFTSSSITATSLKSPMSGILMSMATGAAFSLPRPLAGEGWGEGAVACATAAVGAWAAAPPSPLPSPAPAGEGDEEAAPSINTITSP